MLLILLDIRRDLLTLKGCIRCTSDCANNIQITLEKNSLCLKSFENSSFIREVKILMPDNILQPNTISSLWCKNSKDYFLSLGDNIVNMCISLYPASQEPLSDEKTETTEVTFLLKLCNISVIENCILRNSDTVDFKGFMQNKFKKYETYYIFCAECGSLLTEKGINFKSVQKYHEDSAESSDTWFCHKNDQMSFDSSTDSLYISDMHFYIHHSVLKDFRLAESVKCYKCSKCSSVLSLKKKMNVPHYIGFYCDKIMLEKSEVETSTIQKYKKDIALFAFCSIIQDLLKLSNSCNIYLQSKMGSSQDNTECSCSTENQTSPLSSDNVSEDNDEVLLMELNSQRICQVLLHEVDDNQIPCEIDFEGKEVYRVLYLLCSRDSERSKKWRHNFGVDFFLISDNMMAVIKGVLQESSKYVASDKKPVEGFSFGYLPVYDSII